MLAKSFIIIVTLFSYNPGESHDLIYGPYFASDGQEDCRVHPRELGIVLARIVAQKHAVGGKLVCMDTKMVTHD